jgi:hypothetical protein
MKREIDHVKSLYPRALFAGIADGAKSNCDFLGPYIDEQVLDFYHASQYLARAASALHQHQHQQEREQWLDEQCHNLKHKHRAAQRIVRELEQASTATMKPDQKKDLQDCITYFGNHLHQMRYARYVENGIPIGSGVTEAACKTLVKQRLCCSDALDPRGRANHPKPASTRPHGNQMGTVLAKDKPVWRSRYNETLITGYTRTDVARS